MWNWYVFKYRSMQLEVALKRFVIEMFRLSGIAEQIRSLSSGKEAVKR